MKEEIRSHGWPDGDNRYPGNPKSTGENTVRRTTFKSQSELCFYCGLKTVWDKWTVDHKIPKSRYHEFGYQKEGPNKVGCCSNCNHAKGNMTFDEFIRTDFLPRVRRVILGFSGEPVSFSVEKHKHALRLAPDNPNKLLKPKAMNPRNQIRNKRTHFEKEHYAFTWEYGFFL